jgi:hypothetical protein
MSALPNPGQPVATGSGITDFITGSAIAALGLAAIWGGLLLPRPTGVRPLTAYLTYPGAMPLVIGVLVFAGGLVVARAGWQSRRVAGAVGSGRTVWRLETFRRGAGVLSLILLYVGCLVAGLLPFWVATYLYLALTMVWLRVRSLLRIIGLALGVALFLHVTFGIILRLPLP